MELDAKGIPWYTGNKNGSVGKVDPATGKVTVYKMPDPAGIHAHLVFDKQGIAWFTLQNSNMVGRLDPESGDIKLATLPTPDSKPYGIKIDADGVPWFHATGAPASTRSTRRPWRSRKSSCRSPARRSGVSISPTTA